MTTHGITYSLDQIKQFSHDRQIINSAAHHVAELSIPINRTQARGIEVVLRAIADTVGDVTEEQLAYYSQIDSFGTNFEASTDAAIRDTLEILSVFSPLSEAQLRGIAGIFRRFAAQTGNFWLDR